MKFAMIQALRRMRLNISKTIFQALQLVISFFLLACFINIYSSTNDLSKRDYLADTKPFKYPGCNPPDNTIIKTRIQALP